MIARACVVIVFVVSCAPIARAQPPSNCLEVRDSPDEPRVTVPEADVRQEIWLTDHGKQQLQGARFGYLRVVRPSEGSAPPIAFVRMLDVTEQPISFTFSREGEHQLELYAVKDAWPSEVVLGNPLCVQSQKVLPFERRADFQGTRGQWWVGYRPWKSGELGGSWFYQRLGLAATVIGTVPDPLREEDEPKEENLVTGTAEMRWRGARGYLGGGIKYFPDAVPDRYHVRAIFVAGEELPAYRRRSFWLLFELRVDEPQPNIFRGLSFSIGIRHDLPGTRP